MRRVPDMSRLANGLVSTAVCEPCSLDYEICGAAGLKIHQERKGLLQATGLKVWPAARVLAEHVIRQGVRGRHILELGAGTGAVGLACSLAGAQRVILTDRLVLSSGYGDRAAGRQQLDLLERNLSLNRPSLAEASQISVVELDFAAAAGEASSASAVCKQHGPFDLVLGSDLTYNRAALPQLALCLSQVLRVQRTAGSPGCPAIILAHQLRQRGDWSYLTGTFDQEGLCTQLIHSVDDVSLARVGLAGTASDE